MLNDPKVTVLMSVYNGEKFLLEAIESILNQTFKDFEFLIVNDASTDSSRDIVLSYNDPRIRLVDNEQNIGVTKSLNKGLKLAKGEYIARMDADDISMPERLEKQVEFMEEHQDVGLMGCWVKVINEHGEMQNIWQTPQSHGYIRWLLLFDNPFAHSAAVYRSKVVKNLGGYREEFRHAQDYDLWARMSFETKICQIPEVLVKLRKHPDRIYIKCFEGQEKTVKSVMRDEISRMLERDIPTEQIDDLRTALLDREVENISSVFSLLLSIYDAFKKKVVISKDEKKLILHDLINKMYKIFRRNKTLYPIEARKALGKAVLSDKDIFIYGFKIFTNKKIKGLLILF